MALVIRDLDPDEEDHLMPPLAQPTNGRPQVAAIAGVAQGNEELHQRGQRVRCSEESGLVPPSRSALSLCDTGPVGVEGAEATAIPAESDASGRLAELETPAADRVRVADVGLATRLYSTKALHRLIPAAIAVRLAFWAGAIRWYLSPARRQEACEWASVVLGPRASRRSVRRVARAGLGEEWAKQECFWRPWKTHRRPVEGIEQLEDLGRAGRGAVVAYAHVGPHTSLMHALASHGFRIYLPRWRRPQDEKPQRGYAGLRRRELLRRIEASGGHWVGRGNSHEVLRLALERGGVCVIAADVRGSVPSRMLGQEVGLAAGPASLAMAAGVPLIPALTLLRGGRQRIALLDPVDAHPAAGVAGLHHALIAKLDPIMRENAAQIYPRRPPLPDFEAQRKGGGAKKKGRAGAKKATAPTEVGR